MIDFEHERRLKVAKFLPRSACAPGTDHGLEPIYKTLAQSFKVISLQRAMAPLVGALGFLFTGRPANFQRLNPEQALTLAERLFARPFMDGTGGLLLRHAKAVLSVAPRPCTRGKGAGSGYVDFEDSHLTLIGGSYLFHAIVTALVQPYVEPSPVTHQQRVAAEVAYWMKPDVIEAAIEGRRAWPEWKSAIRPYIVTVRPWDR